MKQHTLVCIILLFLLIGCGGDGADTAVNPTPTTDPIIAMQAAIQATIAASQADRGEQIAGWLADLTAAEARWQAATIDDYVITVTYSDGLKGVYQTHTATVRDGEVVEKEVACSEETPDCVFEQIDWTAVTVPGLFATARTALIEDEINTEGQDFNFDETYGVPGIISLQSLYWLVNSFEILDE